MNSSDNENNSDSNSDANLEITKSSAVVVSSNNDQISIHTNILELKSKSIEEYDNLNFDNKKDQTEGTIIDVSRLVYKLDIEGIKSLILDEVNHKIDDNCKYMIFLMTRMNWMNLILIINIKIMIPYEGLKIDLNSKNFHLIKWRYWKRWWVAQIWV